MFKTTAQSSSGRPVSSVSKGKPCQSCGAPTVMGKMKNTPQRARERYDGKAYVRFCGPECEAKAGW